MSIKHKIKIKKYKSVFDDKTVSDDYKTGGAYRAMLKLFRMHKQRTQIIFKFKCLIQKCREKGKWALAIRLRDRLYENYS